MLLQSMNFITQVLSRDETNLCGNGIKRDEVEEENRTMAAAASVANRSRSRLSALCVLCIQPRKQ